MALYTDIFCTDFLCRWLSIHRQGSSALLRGPACRSTISMRPLAHAILHRSRSDGISAGGPAQWPWVPAAVVRRHREARTDSIQNRRQAWSDPDFMSRTCQTARVQPDFMIRTGNCDAALVAFAAMVGPGNPEPALRGPGFPGGGIHVDS